MFRPRDCLPPIEFVAISYLKNKWWWEIMNERSRLYSAYSAGQRVGLRKTGSLVSDVSRSFASKNLRRLMSVGRGLYSALDCAKPGFGAYRLTGQCVHAVAPSQATQNRGLAPIGLRGDASVRGLPARPSMACRSTLKTHAFSAFGTGFHPLTPPSLRPATRNF